jgi:uncharacterized protein (TIGR03437 family)
MTLIDGRLAVCLIGMIALLTPALCRAQGYTITIVAGTGGNGGYSGDGGPATGAKLNAPYGVALDSSGNLYIADYNNNNVRKIAVSGIITTVAGSDSNGYSGDGGPATSAKLSGPSGLAVDTSGNLYIADTGNHVIRKVSANGTITTVAGGGSGCSQQTDAEGDGCPATSAKLVGTFGYRGTGVAVDTSGNLYISDADTIRKVSANGTITILAGVVGNFGGGYSGDGGLASNARLSNPQGLALDSAGELYIADTDNEVIRKISANGTITTVAGSNSAGFSGDGGAAVDAKLHSPQAVAVDSSGNLYIADNGNARVREVLANGPITTIGGNGGSAGAGCAVSLIPSGGPAVKAAICGVAGVAVNAAGDVYVADGDGQNLILLLTPPPGPPAVGQGGVVSASAFGEFASVAPGSWIEIYGSNLAPDTRGWTGSDFNGVNAPESLDGTSVTIGGQPAYVSFISPGQVNVQVPSNIGTGSQPLIVTTQAGGAGNSYSVTVNAEEPGLLAPSSFKLGANQYVVALFPDNTTYVLPTGAIAGITSRPAQPGDTIILYGIGFGAVTPSTPAGQLAEQLDTLAAPFHVFFGSIEASVAYDGLAPGFVGLYQFNVVVPNVSSSDLVPLTFTLAGTQGAQTLYIAVQ